MGLFTGAYQALNSLIWDLCRWFLSLCLPFKETHNSRDRVLLQRRMNWDLVTWSTSVGNASPGGHQRDSCVTGHPPNYTLRFCFFWDSLTDKKRIIWLIKELLRLEFCRMNSFTEGNVNLTKRRILLFKRLICLLPYEKSPEHSRTREKSEKNGKLNTKQVAHIWTLAEMQCVLLEFFISLYMLRLPFNRKRRLFPIIHWENEGYCVVHIKVSDFGRTK